MNNDPSIPLKTRPYILGEEPYRDPCLNCVINMICNDSCVERVLWNRKQTREKPVLSRVRIKKRRRKKNDNIK